MKRSKTKQSGVNTQINKESLSYEFSRLADFPRNDNLPKRHNKKLFHTQSQLTLGEQFEKELNRRQRWSSSFYTTGE